MAPIALIFGGFCGTFSALVGWVVFGLSLWGAVQLYFVTGLAVAAALIVLTLLRPRKTDRTAKSTALQQA